MNRDGLILNEIGLGPLMDRLIQYYLGPVCAALYPRLLGQGFEAHHSFIVQYSMATDRSLGVHDDNSEVLELHQRTLTACVITGHCERKLE